MAFLTRRDKQIALRLEARAMYQRAVAVDPTIKRDFFMAVQAPGALSYEEKTGVERLKNVATIVRLRGRILDALGRPPLEPALRIILSDEIGQTIVPVRGRTRVDIDG